jgi:hydrogenase large subunit
MLARVREMRAFLQATLFGTVLEEVAELASLADLQHWRQRAAGSDMAFFLDIADEADLAQMGPGPGRYLSYGAYHDEQGQSTWARGVWDAGSGQRQMLETTHITEDTHHAWYTDAPQGVPLHPSAGMTQPDADKPGAYTWNKAPRLAGQVMETGALARQMVAGQPLIRAAVLQGGGNVLTRVLARLVEIARMVPLMEQWLMALQPHAPFHQVHTLPDQAQGTGLVEAARGALGHWLRVEDGRISHYQIIAPTSWNFSPRDADGTPGALEAALIGATMDAQARGDGDATSRQSVAVQHIVRSFDPCMVCTVH